MAESFFESNKWYILSVTLVIFVTGIGFLAASGSEKTADGKKVEFSKNSSMKIGVGLMGASGIVILGYLLLFLAS